ncbi:MAG: hypothetical protein PUA88_01155 [Bacillales bacterium]|nr:hypothetical protein [Bacillales bacterium]
MKIIILSVIAVLSLTNNSIDNNKNSKVKKEILRKTYYDTLNVPDFESRILSDDDYDYMMQNNFYGDKRIEYEFKISVKKNNEQYNDCRIYYYAGTQNSYPHKVAKYYSGVTFYHEKGKDEVKYSVENFVSTAYVVSSSFGFCGTIIGNGLIGQAVESSKSEQTISFGQDTTIPRNSSTGYYDIYFYDYRISTIIEIVDNKGNIISKEFAYNMPYVGNLSLNYEKRVTNISYPTC